ncbi:23S rRNA (uracil(1939)-C(5))-methyltransferase RlmD [Alkalitalea saponilacus]|uniref:23S rRNA (Uracil1939-C5)-methyltransferase n=1 Tax=Alkalitalea saponilacus TaxID=889453 RepID=A0A1T5F816_9BACT|nr:23S rRNA (uracil(1939)-C(5))-methyltransferase RlmD [Alkalitalea saponilacus]ASB50142.1 23S rRNA (uracil(1939)-C(5))-methyltransferase RlmD [Alkalitalea saponilacus]SKB92315.1 23S rRNA (uracil1939-C5)-methyltransferase [Alkalitalea saponilacus]
MGRSRKNKPLLERLVITDVAAEGKSLGKINDKVVFVTQTIPGDIVDVQVNKKRKNYYEGFPIRFHYYSDLRVDPFCSHFGVCGGCKWQALPYTEQLFYKQREVKNNLVRIGKVEIPEVMPILASNAERFYRNKLEFTFSNKRWLTQEEIDSGDEITDGDALGFHIPGMFDKVVDVEKCYLQSDPSNQIRLAIKEYALEKGLEFFDIRAKAGYLRTLIIRTSSTGEVMVILSLFNDDSLSRADLFNHMISKFPEVTSWMYVINNKANDTITDLDVKLFAGRDHIFESMEDLKFKIGPKSFYQTNSEQAYNLYKVARDFAGLTGDETVYDLYTGTGTIANFIARNAKKVVGIEYVPEAIEDAIKNSEINGIDNTIFLAGDMKDMLTHTLFEQHGRPDVIITDPPRAGMHSDVVETILNAAPDKIVYVSCNSATQARDINLLDIRYRVAKVQPVDMFPHTHHVENVVLLERR